MEHTPSVHHVCSFLPSTSTVSLLCCSSYLRCAVAGGPAIIQEARTDLTSSQISALLRTFCSIAELHVLDAGLLSPRDFLVAFNIPSLRVVEFRRIPPPLTLLAFTGASPLDDSPLSLHCVELEGCVAPWLLNTVLHRCHNLKMLCVESSAVLPLREVANYCETHPQLRMLCIAGFIKRESVPRGNMEGALQFHVHSEGLSTLELRLLPFPQPLCVTCPRLESCELIAVHATDSTVARLIAAAPRLLTLRLRCLERLRTLRFVHLTLQRLTCELCTSLTSVDIDCPNLVVFDADHCCPLYSVKLKAPVLKSLDLSMQAQLALLSLHCLLLERLVLRGCRSLGVGQPGAPSSELKAVGDRLEQAWTLVHRGTQEWHIESSAEDIAEDPFSQMEPTRHSAAACAFSEKHQYTAAKDTMSGAPFTYDWEDEPVADEIISSLATHCPLLQLRMSDVIGSPLLGAFHFFDPVCA